VTPDETAVSMAAGYINLLKVLAYLSKNDSQRRGESVGSTGKELPVA
jgi:hypothetical protein